MGLEPPPTPHNIGVWHGGGLTPHWVGSWTPATPPNRRKVNISSELRN